MSSERDRMAERNRLLVAMAAAGLMYAISGSRVGGLFVFAGVYAVLWWLGGGPGDDADLNG